MWNGEEHTENPQGELTQEQEEHIAQEFMKILCWEDAGIDPLMYNRLATELLEVVKTTLYYSKENR
jgi:hypothetical protein